MSRKAWMVVVCMMALSLGCRSRSKTEKRSTETNPPNTTWLSPWLGGRDRHHRNWMSLRVPQRFYFRQLGHDKVFCTDRKGALLWKRHITGSPLWDYNCDARAFIVRGKTSAAVTWVSITTGAKTKTLKVKLPLPRHAEHFLIGRNDGDLLCRWDEGMPQAGEPFAYVQGPLRFYVNGKRVSVWDPRKNGYKMRHGLGRRADGSYVALGEKEGKRTLLTFNREGKLLKSERRDSSALLPYYFGDYRSGPKDFGYQLKGKVLEVTREKVRPNTLDSHGHYVTWDGKGKQVPVTVLWKLEVGGEICDVTAERDGHLYLLTHRSSKTGGNWTVLRVDLKKREVIAETRLGAAGHHLMGPGSGYLYGFEVIDPDKDDGAAKRVLRRHKRR
jgi:hypothetical protein